MPDNTFVAVRINQFLFEDENEVEYEDEQLEALHAYDF